MTTAFTQWVSPMIGVDSGNCLIGPYRPFSPVRPGPDCDMPHRAAVGFATTGYQTGRPVIGFSQTHVAGTGGLSHYGNIRIMPFCGRPHFNDARPFFQVPWERREDALLQDETCGAGFYRAWQNHFKIGIEISSTPHVAAYRFSFQKDEAAWLLVDGGSCIEGLRSPSGEICPFERWEQEPDSIGGYMEICGERSVRGRADLRGGWGNAMPYSIYFQMEFDQKMEIRYLANAEGMVPAGIPSLVAGRHCIGCFGFGNISELNVRIGISFSSIANAEGALRRESDGRSFENLVADSAAEWEKLLGRFRVSGGTETQKTLFYTMLYRLYCMPTDLGIDYDNPFWKSGRRFFTDYYSLWDSIRCADSFFLLFDPETASDLLNNLIDIAHHSGDWLPDAFIAGRFAYMQSGCSANVLFAEAAGKGVPGVDFAEAFRILRHNNEAESPNPMIAGREREDWNRLGFISTRMKKGSVSRHIEYAFYDWSVAELAERLGDRECAEHYRKEAEKLWNLWDEQTGLFMPRDEHGNFIRNFDPWDFGSDAHNHFACYEAPPAIWSLNALSGFPELIERCGGEAAFEAWLDRLFERKLWYLKDSMTHVPHLYTLIGKPEKSAERVAKILGENYRVSSDGLRDDEDFGCQSSWYLWNVLGLYPFIGHDFYTVVPPIFDGYEISLGKGVLRATVDRSRGGKYIARLECNGRSLERAWIFHREIAEGADLHFVLSDTPVGFSHGKTPFDQSNEQNYSKR